MRRIVAGLVLALCISAAQAANTSVPSMTPAAALTGSELQYCVQSNGDTKCTTQAVADANVVNPLVGYNASGSIATTTGTCSTSSTSLAVGSASGWSIGMGIAVANAGTGGNTELITSVTNIVGTTFTLNNACVSGVTTQTVNHDDTAAISSAITAAMSAAKPLHLQAGSYNVTSGLTAFNSSPYMYGDGRTLSMIWNRSATANVLTINYQNSLSPVTTTISGTFRDFGISQASGVTPTAGAGLLIGSSSSCGPCTNYTSSLTIQNVTLNGLWAGIKTQNGLIRDYFLNIDINNSVGTCTGTAGTSGGGIVYNSPSPGGDNDWVNIQIAMTSAGDGLCILNADTQTFMNLKVNTGTGGTGGGVKFKGGTILRQTFVNPSIEGNQAQPTCGFDFNSGTITQATITGGEVALIATPFCNTGNVTGGLAIVGTITVDNSGNPTGTATIMTGLPTSCTSKPTGTLINNSGVVNICP